MNWMGKAAFISTVVALAVGAPMRAAAQTVTTNTTNAADATPAAKPAAKAPKQPKAATFSGKLAAVDKIAMTITLDDKAKRTFQITSETVLMKAGKPAIFDDAVLGEKITGSYHKADDGKLVARTVNFGGKPPKAAAAKTNAPPAADTMK